MWVRWNGLKKLRRTKKNNPWCHCVGDQFKLQENSLPIPKDDVKYFRFVESISGPTQPWKLQIDLTVASRRQTLLVSQVRKKRVLPFESGSIEGIEELLQDVSGPKLNLERDTFGAVSIHHTWNRSEHTWRLERLNGWLRAPCGMSFNPGKVESYVKIGASFVWWKFGERSAGVLKLEFIKYIQFSQHEAVRTAL